ncbi:MAG: type II toxin-antitoxin system HicB family antitoxin [Thermoanaerobaculia bacterium]
MDSRFILSDYVEQALALAEYDKLEDGTFGGTIPPCVGVIAFGATLRDCADSLHSTLEDWILLGLKLRHPLPVIAGINLNEAPQHESVDAL